MPTIPACLIVDVFTRTTHALRKTRLYYESGEMPADSTAAQTVANGFLSTWGPILAPLLPETHSVERVDVLVQDGGGTTIEGTSTVAAVPGDITQTLPEVDADHADELPDEVSLIVQRRTGLSGRANRGRIFVTGLSERVQKAGRVDPDYNDEVLAVAGQLATDVTLSSGTGYAGGTFHARHWNRKTNTLKVITVARVVKIMGSRIDRRRPLALNEIVVL